MSSLGRIAHMRLVMPHLRPLILLALSLLSAVPVSAETVTQIENKKPGTAEWEIVYKTKTSPSVDFFPDRHFTSGSPATYITRPIANTEDDALYLTVRYSFNDFRYKIPVRNGAYTLKLHFAECWFGHHMAGTRLFHVDVNGSRVLSNFDISAQAGGPNIALVTSFSNQQVTDGFVTVDFVNVLNGPVVAAVELIPNDPAGTTTRIDAAGYGDAALNHEIEGYASLTSVNRGGQIDLFVNTSDPTYTIDIYRMGWYGGLGARKVAGPITRTGVAQAMPTHDPSTGFLECAWVSPYTLTVPNNPSDPTDWASGVYLAKLTGSSGKQSYIIFVVRDDGRASDFLYQSSVTTYQAYNNWGGKSLYDYPLSTQMPIISDTNSHRAAKVSFNRPYAPNVFKPEAATGAGAGEFLTNAHQQERVLPAGWEYNVVRFLEREGYDVTYCTDIDTHANPNLIAPHKAFLSVGHDEYWTWQMRAHVEAARDGGRHLAFLGSNAVFYQIRLEASGVTGQAARTMVGYKRKNPDQSGPTGDPFATDADPGNNQFITVQWRDSLVNRPEDSLIGVRYRLGANPVDADIVIENDSHWACRGACLTGDTLRRLLGVEADERVSGFPVPEEGIIGKSPYAHPQDGRQHSHMTAYDAPSGATVFATGTMVWGWGLDDFNKEIMGLDLSIHRPKQDNLVNVKAQWMTRNVLARFLGLPCPSAGETIWAEDGLPPGAVSVPGTHTFNGVTWTNEAWNWNEEPRPYARELSARSGLPSGLQPALHQLYFSSAPPLAVNAGDKLIAYVYLDPHNPPTEVMLQWLANGSWEHRAYWGTPGANQIPWGGNDPLSPSHRFQGYLPPAGQWVRLEVAAADVGLVGSSLTGMALTLYGGRANWDHLGKFTAPAPGKCN